MNLIKALFNLSLLLLASLAYGQGTAVTIAPVPELQFLDQNGRPLAFGCVFTYASGTSTPLPTFTDYTGTVQNGNPVTLSASGSANIWLQAGSSYTMAVKSNGGTDCSLGTLMYSVDGIGGGSTQITTVIPATSGSVSFTSQGQFQLFLVTLTGDMVGLPVSFLGVTPPALVTFQITEDAVGGHTFTWPANVTGGVSIDTAANHATSQTFVWNGTILLPVGAGFNSAGNTLIPGNVASTNTYTGANTFTPIQTFNGGIVDTTLTASKAVCTNGSSRLITAGCSAGIVHTICADGSQHVANANSAASQVVTTCKIPAGDLNAIGASFRITTALRIDPAGAGPPSSTADLAYGSSASLASGLFHVTGVQGAASTVYNSAFTVVCTVRDLGATGHAGCSEVGPTQGASSNVVASTETIVLDTASDFYVGPKCSFSAGDVLNTCTTDNLTVEQLN